MIRHNTIKQRINMHWWSCWRVRDCSGSEVGRGVGCSGFRPFYRRLLDVISITYILLIIRQIYDLAFRELICRPAHPHRVIEAGKARVWQTLRKHTSTGSKSSGRSGRITFTSGSHFPICTRSRSSTRTTGRTSSGLAPGILRVTRTSTRSNDWFSIISTTTRCIGVFFIGVLGRSNTIWSTCS